jgi:hypothetical protein
MKWKIARTTIGIASVAATKVSSASRAAVRHFEVVGIVRTSRDPDPLRSQPLGDG